MIIKHQTPSHHNTTTPPSTQHHNSRNTVPRHHRTIPAYWKFHNGTNINNLRKTSPPEVQWYSMKTPIAHTMPKMQQKPQIWEQFTTFHSGTTFVVVIFHAGRAFVNFASAFWHTGDWKSRWWVNILANMLFCFHIRPGKLDSIFPHFRPAAIFLRNLISFCQIFSKQFSKPHYCEIFEHKS